ncbi:MAG: nitrophenyl compound nitroreductase subunit ArsF family protein [Bacteroidales bacterium]
MKNIFLLMISMSFIFGTSACSQASADGQSSRETIAATEKVDVYYFHFTRRCVTCVSVQEATEKVLKEHYGKEIENGKIVFHEINLSDPGSKEIAQMLEVGGQALLVVSGSKKVDITVQGFMHAPRDYDRFKNILDSAISDAKT